MEFPGKSGVLLQKGTKEKRGSERTEAGRVYRALEIVTVRAEASLGSPVVQELAKGELLKALSSSQADGRFRVLLLDGKVGWASAITRKQKTTLFAEELGPRALSAFPDQPSPAESGPREYYVAGEILERFPSAETPQETLLQLEKESQAVLRRNAQEIGEVEEVCPLDELTIGYQDEIEQEALLAPVSESGLPPAAGVSRISMLENTAEFQSGEVPPRRPSQTRSRGPSVRQQDQGSSASLHGGPLTFPRKLEEIEADRCSPEDPEEPEKGEQLLFSDAEGCELGCLPAVPHGLEQADQSPGLRTPNSSSRL